VRSSRRLHQAKVLPWMKPCVQLTTTYVYGCITVIYSHTRVQDIHIFYSFNSVAVGCVDSFKDADAANDNVDDDLLSLRVKSREELVCI